MSAIHEVAKGGSEEVPRAIQTVLEALDKLKFGAIQLTVHEGRLVQVDVTERHRYPN
ncbi:MAG: YezD family protein [Proteobacteria bacterium]|nr:YezD family protein [Pseudomonadota bacterium]